jgi:hypothetical protein
MRFSRETPRFAICGEFSKNNGARYAEASDANSGKSAVSYGLFIVARKG